MQSRRQSAYKELVSFTEHVVKDLVGKKTRDGKKLRLELDKERHCATMYAGDEKFLYLHFWYRGDRTYYLKKK